MYAFKNESEDELFQDRSFKIKQMKPKAVMEYLGIDKKFIPNEKFHQRFSISKESNEQSVTETGGSNAATDRKTVPYIDAIREIEKIQQYTCPVEMIGCLSASFERLKTAVVDQHKGKFELSTMDDVLPLSIYVVSMANLEQPVCHKNMMEDYLRCNLRGYDLERKLLCNFDGAIRYVCNDWELDE